MVDQIIDFFGKNLYFLASCFKDSIPKVQTSWMTPILKKLHNDQSCMRMHFLLNCIHMQTGLQFHLACKLPRLVSFNSFGRYECCPGRLGPKSEYSGTKYKSDIIFLCIFKILTQSAKISYFLLTCNHLLKNLLQMMEKDNFKK